MLFRLLYADRATQSMVGLVRVQTGPNHLFPSTGLSLVGSRVLAVFVRRCCWGTLDSVVQLLFGHKSRNRQLDTRDLALVDTCRHLLTPPDGSRSSRTTILRGIPIGCLLLRPYSTVLTGYYPYCSAGNTASQARF